MKNYNKLVAGMLGASMVFGVVGCSSDSSPVVTTPAHTVQAPLAAQTATIVINDPYGATPTVTVTTAAADIALSGVAIQGTAADGIIDVNLTATNNAPRVLTNLKAVIDTIVGDVGTPVVSTSSGTYNTLDYTYFGPAIAEGASADSGADGTVITGVPPIPDTTTTTLRISAIDATATTVTLGVTMPTDHPLFTMTRRSYNNGYNLVDTATSESMWVDTDAVAMSDDDGGVTSGVGSLDGTTLYMGSRNTGSIIVTDLTTIADDTVDSISGIVVSESAVASVRDVYRSTDGNTLYALVSEGSHGWFDTDNWYDYSNQLRQRLVKVDLDTLTVTGSVEMATGGYTMRARSLDIADDGITAVVVNSGYDGSQLDMINLATMTVTATVNVPMDISQEQFLFSAAITGDGTTVYAMYRDDEYSESQMIIVDVASGDVQREAVDLGIWSPYKMDFGPDDMLYMATDNGLFRFNPSTYLMTEMKGSDTNAMTFDEAGEKLYATQRSNATGYVYDIATGQQLDTDGNDDGVVGGMNFPSSSNGHLSIVTTY